jgi:class 3 adenylate cyclase
MNRTSWWRWKSIDPRVPEHRTIVVVDMAGSGSWHNQVQLRARAALTAAVRAALRGAGIPRHSVAVEDRGDGMILLFPATVPKVAILDPAIRLLAERIHAHNVTSGDPRIRLRLSVHAGEVHRHGRGWAGTDLNTACRLVNAAPLYDLLREDPGTDLAMVLSDLIYQGTARHHYRDIDPAGYDRVSVQAKELTTTAWLTARRTAAVTD